MTLRERAEAVALDLDSATYSDAAPFRQEAARMIERVLAAARAEGYAAAVADAARVLAHVADAQWLTSEDEEAGDPEIEYAAEHAAMQLEQAKKAILALASPTPKTPAATHDE